MGLLAVASISKLADLQAFREVLDTWLLVPAELRPALSIAVPALEGLLVLGWLSGCRPQVVRLLAFVFMLGVTLAYALHAASGVGPQCGCFGRIAPSAWDASGLWLRNGVLMFMLVLPEVVHWHSRPASRSVVRTRRDPATVARGLTIIEVIVAVLVLATLVALALAALHGVRRRGREAQDLANMASHARIMHAYTADWADLWPWLVDAREGTGPIRNPARGVELRVPYFGASELWNVGLAAAYYEGEHQHQAFRSPLALARSDGTPIGTSYGLVCALLAEPRYWTMSRGDPREECVVMRSGRTRFPAEKSLLVRGSSADSMPGPGAGSADAPRMSVGFVDGHALITSADRLDRGYGVADGHWEGMVHGTATTPGMHTIDGAEGRDVRGR